MKSKLKMKLAMNKDVINNTTKCKKGLSCLKGNEEILCEVNDCVDGKVLFILPKDNTGFCEYKMAFGYSFICNCPVRKEIYNNYHF